jgi:hypothetical protein
VFVRNEEIGGVYHDGSAGSSRAAIAIIATR